MKKKWILLVFFALVIFGFIPLWDQTSLFGTRKINSYELFGGCWQGDVRLCDYNPFD